MKAAQLVGRKLFEFIEVDMPTIQDGECLIKLERVSICGSDIRHGYGPRYPGMSYPLEVGRPCHECAGVVAKPNGRLPCGAAGHCPARRWHGRPDRVPRRLSGPADRLARPWRPDGVGHVPACRHRALRLPADGKRPRQERLDGGQGAIGLSFTMLTAMQGARQVIAVDLLDYRLQWAKDFGATHTINPGTENLADAMREMTSGVGPDVTVEAAGYPETLDAVFRLVRQFGTVIVFGVQGDDIVPVDTRLWLDKQATIIPTTGPAVATRPPTSSRWWRSRSAGEWIRAGW